jgi:hypothetical protein
VASDRRAGANFKQPLHETRVPNSTGHGPRRIPPSNRATKGDSKNCAKACDPIAVSSNTMSLYVPLRKGTLSRLPSCERRRGNRSCCVMNPTGFMLLRHISGTIPPRTAPSSPVRRLGSRAADRQLPTGVIGCLQWSGAFESFHGHSDHEAQPLPMRDEGISAS